MSDTMEQFDSLTCDLEGMHLVEAAAGTGKTYNIQNLVARLILECDIPIEKILVVTFTKAAATELANRIREILSECLIALEEKRVKLQNGKTDNNNERESQLIDKALEKNDWKDCQQKLRKAIQSFDVATITTIHGFCQKVLRENAVESGVLFNREPVNDCNDLLRRAALDQIRQKFYPTDNEQKGEHDNALRQVLLEAGGFNETNLVTITNILITHPDADAVIIPNVYYPGSEKLDTKEVLDNIKKKLENVKNLDTKEVLDNIKKKLENITADECINFWEEEVKSEKFLNKPFSGKELDKFIDDLKELKVSSGIPTRDLLNFLRNNFKESVVKSKLDKKKRDANGIYEKWKNKGKFAPFFSLSENIENFQYKALMDAATEIKEQCAKAKEQSNIITFDDMVMDVWQALKNNDHNQLQEKLQEQYCVGIVDEFQDSDPYQYEIFKKIFIEPVKAIGEKPVRTLFLVGDSRQAIYSFRGGDIYTYLMAKKDVDALNSKNIHTLTCNYRSTEKMVAGVNHILKDRYAFGDPEIPTPEVSSGSKAKELEDTQSQETKALQIFNQPEKSVDECISITVDLIKDLLSGNLSIPPKDPKPQTDSKLRPSDIAVLFDEWKYAKNLKAQLSKASIPAVIYKAESVYRSELAKEILIMLYAMAAPENTGKVLDALATSIAGFNLNQIMDFRKDTTNNTEAEKLADYQGFFNDLRKSFRPDSFITIFTRIMDRFKVLSEFAKQPGGERMLTDLYQLGDLLQNKCSSSKLSLTGLIKFLENMVCSNSGASDMQDEHKQLLESDRDAVKLNTIFGSKGLQYPIVILPTLFKLGTNKQGNSICRYHIKSATKYKLVYCLYPFEGDKNKCCDEILLENQRIAYVGLTRSIYRCYVMWGWAGKNRADHSPLTWLATFTNSNNEGSTPPPPPPPPPSPYAELKKVSKNIPRKNLKEFLVDTLPPENKKYEIDPESFPAPNAEALSWDSNKLTGYSYRVESFSSLVPSESAPLVHYDSDADHDDSQPDELPVLGEVSSGSEITSMDLPAGKDFGNAIHTILQKVVENPSPISSQKNLITNLIKENFEKKLKYADNPMSDYDMETCIFKMLSNAFGARLRNHLGEEFSLSEIDSHNRLAEMKFIFGFTKNFNTKDIPKAIKNYLDSNRAEFSRIDQESRDRLKDEYNFSGLEHPSKSHDVSLGFMNGVIDVLFSYKGRYYIVDWKTNRLGGIQKHFTIKNLSEEMGHSYYFLQYLIYTVATIKFMRRFLNSSKNQSQRQSDRDYYEEKFGGVYYMFLRGIRENQPPNGDGVYFTRPPYALVSELEKIISPEKL